MAGKKEIVKSERIVSLFNLPVFMAPGYMVQELLFAL